MKSYRNRIRAMALAAAGAATVLAGVSVVGAATAAMPREPEFPSYAIPNIAAIVMCLAALAIPCKRFRRT